MHIKNADVIAQLLSTTGYSLW